MAKRRRHTPEQIIRKLNEGNKLLAGGAELNRTLKLLNIINEFTCECPPSWWNAPSTPIGSWPPSTAWSSNTVRPLS